MWNHSPVSLSSMNILRRTSSYHSCLVVFSRDPLSLVQLIRLMSFVHRVMHFAVLRIIESSHSRRISSLLSVERLSLHNSSWIQVGLAGLSWVIRVTVGLNMGTEELIQQQKIISQSTELGWQGQGLYALEYPIRLLSYSETRTWKFILL